MTSARATAALLIVAALPARAYRPFNSTDAAVADLGRVEIELGPAGLVEEGGDRFVIAPSLVLNWGFAERWEVVLEGRQFVRVGGSVPHAPRLRVDDNALSLKTVLREGALQDKSGLSVATEVGVLLPAIEGEGGTGVEAALIASQRWEALTVHINGAASWTRAHAPGAFGGVIVEVHDAWRLRPITEVFVEGERDVPFAVSWLGGAIFRFRDDLSFDAGLRLARAGGTGTTEIRLGLTWEFGGSHESSDRFRRVASRRR
jgi:hypothetical protein